MYFYVAVDPESNPIPESMDQDQDSVLWKMKNSLNQTDHRSHLPTLDRYANFFVVHSTISGPCNVPYDVKCLQLKLSKKLHICQQDTRNATKNCIYKGSK